MKKLNEEELMIGAVCGFCTVLWTGVLCIPLTTLTAILWAVGGAGIKSVRRYGVPFVWCLAVYFAHGGNLLAFLPFPFMVALLSIGYGLPSTQPYDEGSFLGRFWWKITDWPDQSKEEHEMMAEFWTRASIYIGLFMTAQLWWIIK